MTSKPGPMFAEEHGALMVKATILPKVAVVYGIPKVVKFGRRDAKFRTEMTVFYRIGREEEYVLWGKGRIKINPKSASQVAYGKVTGTRTKDLGYFIKVTRGLLFYLFFFACLFWSIPKHLFPSISLVGKALLCFYRALAGYLFYIPVPTLDLLGAVIPSFALMRKKLVSRRVWSPAYYS
jgi:hypothetical protein